MQAIVLEEPGVFKRIEKAAPENPARNLDVLILAFF